MKIMLIDSGEGVIPFIYQILKHHKNNDYYIFMDQNYFPYGNKTNYQLKKRLNYIFKLASKNKIDQILICCNTLSKIYLLNKESFKYNFKVTTILELNLNKIKNGSILVTPTLKKLFKNNNQFISSPLAKYIENHDIVNIINEIKTSDYPKNLILGCTHYPLIKSLFKFYKNISPKSYESLMVGKLNSSKDMKFYTLLDQKEIIHRFFPNIVINTY